MSSNSTEPLVLLRDGHAVSLHVLRFAWDLEARGYSLARQGDKLRVSPTRGLTDEDRALLRQHRDALLVLLDVLDEQIGGDYRTGDLFTR